MSRWATRSSRATRRSAHRLAHLPPPAHVPRLACSRRSSPRTEAAPASHLREKRRHRLERGSTCEVRRSGLHLLQPAAGQAHQPVPKDPLDSGLRRDARRHLPLHRRQRRRNQALHGVLDLLGVHRRGGHLVRQGVFNTKDCICCICLHITYYPISGA